MKSWPRHIANILVLLVSLTPCLAGTYYVNSTTGSDTYTGTSAESPFRHIRAAMAAASSGDTINVAQGYYSSESFPIVLKSGVQLIGTSGALSTLISLGYGSPGPLIVCHGNSAGTKIQGFTISGGKASPATGDAFGGGILCDNGDQTTISGNIISANQAVGSNSSSAGANAYGAGICILNSATRVVKNVFRYNTAQGGNGVAGGDAHGGGLYASGPAFIANNTFVGNSAIGGNTTGSVGGHASGGALEGGSNVFNNLISSNTTTVGSGSSAVPAGAVSSATPKNCLYFGNAGGDGVVGTNVVNGDPLFVNPRTCYTRAASPARGAGASLDAPAEDLDGVARPNPPAIGAYETAGGNRADFSGDGINDLLFDTTCNGDLLVWHLMGSMVVGSSVISANRNVGGLYEWKIVGTGDFNDDGWADLVWQNGTGDVAIWLMQGLTRTDAVFPGSVTRDWRIVGVGDFNGDQQPDLLFRNTTTGAVNVWFMRGTTYTGTGATLFTVPTNWRIEAIGDFDGNGTPDIVWRSTVNGYNVIELMDGVVHKASVPIATVSDQTWSVVAAAPYNPTGSYDLLWRNSVDGAIVLWLFTGTTRTSSPVDETWTLHSALPPMQQLVSKLWRPVGPR